MTMIQIGTLKWLAFFGAIIVFIISMNAINDDPEKPCPPTHRHAVESHTTSYMYNVRCGGWTVRE